MDSEKLSSQTVLNYWKSVNQRVSDLIAQISEENIQNEVAPGRNRALYIVGHLTAVSDRMFSLPGVGERRFPNLDTAYLGHPDRTAVNPLTPADLGGMAGRGHSDNRCSRGVHARGVASEAYRGV